MSFQRLIDCICLTESEWEFSDGLLPMPDYVNGDDDAASDVDDDVV